METERRATQRGLTTLALLLLMTAFGKLASRAGGCDGDTEPFPPFASDVRSDPAPPRIVFPQAEDDRSEDDLGLE